jgi:hypothetical protein
MEEFLELKSLDIEAVQFNTSAPRRDGYRWQNVTIPIQEHDTLTDVFLLVDALLKLKTRWELLDHRSQPVTQILQFRHREKHTVPLISERRARTRTLVQKQRPSQDIDYIARLETPVPSMTDYTRGPEILPHEFRDTLIRVFRLKGLRWNLFKHGEGGDYCKSWRTGGFDVKD